jgi:hypothetical protein
MKIFLIDKSSNKKLVNLGGKITFDKLNTLLNNGNSILLRSSDGKTQSDLRIRKVPELKKMDRGYKTIKAFYTINLEMGNEGFEAFSPKKVIFEQNYRFAGLERAINMLEAKQGLKRADWIIEKK